MGLELAQYGDRDAAVAIHDGAYATFSTANLLVPAILAGWVVLAFAAYKGGVLGRWRAAALGVTAVAPAGLATGWMPIAAVAWAGMALALVPLGLWLLGAPGTGPAEARTAAAR